LVKLFKVVAQGLSGAVQMDSGGRRRDVQDVGDIGD